MSVINIGKDFSDHPIGRYRSDGDASGEVFCQDILIPALDRLGLGEKLEIVLDDGVDGYGSSFLVEAFAGVVKAGRMDAKELLGILVFRYSEPDFEFFELKIKQYILEASRN